MTETLAVLAEIHADLEKITEKDIQRVQLRLTQVQPNEKPLGTLHDETLKKLWALSERYHGLTHRYENEIKFDADTKEQALELEKQVQRAASLREIVKNLFWAQAKDDIGGGTWTADGIGLRADWMVVGTAGSPIQSMLGAIVQRLRPPE